MVTEDEKHHPSRARLSGPSSLLSLWLRGVSAFSLRLLPGVESSTTPPDRTDIGFAVCALPTRLDGSDLPNGVVELLVDDSGEQTRQVFDIHDGSITLVEPGECVPWACIAGPATAWTAALGPARDYSGLGLTGDEHLARMVLAALPPLEPASPWI